MSGQQVQNVTTLKGGGAASDRITLTADRTHGLGVSLDHLPRVEQRP
jgi:hypothetical protein